MSKYRLAPETRVALLARRLERDYAASPYAGLSLGPRKVHVADDNAYLADRRDSIHVFHFGAYGCTHVLAFGHLEDALEDAAAVLHDVAPGMFVEPDYDAARQEILDETGCGDDMLDEEDESVRDNAEADLTYTESGWLASYEWSATTFESLAAVREWAANNR